jgi:hypothetical protein
VSAGTLAALLAGGAASAAVPVSLLTATSKAAVLAAAGQLTATASTAAVLTHEVMKAMFMTKLKAAATALVMVVTLGAMVLASRMSYSTAADPPPAKKPSSELEALRRENELLKLNLRVTLEKLESLEAALKAQGPKMRTESSVPATVAAEPSIPQYPWTYNAFTPIETRAPVATDVQNTLNAYLSTTNQSGVDEAIKVLEDALVKLRQKKTSTALPDKPRTK